MSLGNYAKASGVFFVDGFQLNWFIRYFVFSIMPGIQKRDPCSRFRTHVPRLYLCTVGLARIRIAIAVNAPGWAFDTRKRGIASASGHHARIKEHGARSCAHQPFHSHPLTLDRRIGRRLLSDQSLDLPARTRDGRRTGFPCAAPSPAAFVSGHEASAPDSLVQTLCHSHLQMTLPHRFARYRGSRRNRLSSRSSSSSRLHPSSPPSGHAPPGAVHSWLPPTVQRQHRESECNGRPSAKPCPLSV